MNFNLILILLVILVIIYLFDTYNKSNEQFYSDPNLLQSYEPVNYNKRTQNCNELTYSPSKCTVQTVVPKNKIVCNESLRPITNNQIDCDKRKKKTKKNPTVSLQYDFDLLPSFNQAQQNRNNNLEQQNRNNNLEQQKSLNTNTNDNLYVNNTPDLITDIRSLNSLENDLISNF
jgi:hypothetical protein